MVNMTTRTELLELNYQNTMILSQFLGKEILFLYKRIYSKKYAKIEQTS